MDGRSLTVVSYLTEKHQKWLPHWCEQLNQQTTRDFNVLLLFHNWSCTSALNGPSVTVSELLDPTIPRRLVDHCGQPVIGDVINRALDLVDTTYFVHHDVDDVFHPERLELQMKFLNEHPEIDFLGTRMLGFIGEPKPELLDKNYIKPGEPNAHITKHEEIYDCLLKRGENCLGHSSMIYKAQAMRDLGGFSLLNVMTDPQHRSPDFETWKKALRAGYKFHRLPELLVLWNLTSSAIRDTTNARE